MSGTDAETAPKDLRFVASAQKDMRDMPEEVKDGFGYGLWLIQQGETPANASPFEGSTGNDIMKLTEQHDGDTFRCVYAAKFDKVVIWIFHRLTVVVIEEEICVDQSWRRIENEMVVSWTLTHHHVCTVIAIAWTITFKTIR